MLPSLRHPWRRLLLQVMVLYALCVTALLWLLPPPVHFQFSSETKGRLFSPTSEPSLVRLDANNKDSASINDCYIEHIDLQTGKTKRVPLVNGDSKLHDVGFYISASDGSVFPVMNKTSPNRVSLWDGHAGIHLSDILCNAGRLSQMACTSDGTRLALVTKDNSGAIDLYHARTGQALGRMQCTNESESLWAGGLHFSIDGKWLLASCRSKSPGVANITNLFDTTTMTNNPGVANDDSRTIDQIAPAPNGFWIKQWNRSEETLTIAYLDGRTGQRTKLVPSFCSRLAGFPYIFSDNAGHLYLLQNRKPSPNDWQKSTRQKIIDWLKKLGFNWETTDEIVLRHISPDGKRLINEQTFSANYAEISPDGQYLILMSQMKDDSRYVVYHYPTRLNWKHSLFWPLIPAMMLLLWRWRGMKSRDVRAKSRSESPG